MSDIRFRVLGPVEVLSGGVPVPLGGNTTLALLGALLTSPNRIVPVCRLIEWIWDERLPDHPRAALHNAVSRLRRVLGENVLRTHAAGYSMHAEAHQLDLLRFDQLRSAAREAVRRDEPYEAMRALDEAVDLWQEPLLSNVESPVLRGEVVPQLTERFLEAVEERAGLYIQSGQSDAITRDLSAVVSLHPFRERIVGQLMAALNRSGRRADAISAYTTLRRILRDELGIEPSTELQTLLVQILRSDSARARPTQSLALSGRAGRQRAWGKRVDTGPAGSRRTAQRGSMALGCVLSGVSWAGVAGCWRGGRCEVVALVLEVRAGGRPGAWPPGGSREQPPSVG